MCGMEEWEWRENDDSYSIGGGGGLAVAVAAAHVRCLLLYVYMDDDVVIHGKLYWKAVRGETDNIYSGCGTNSWDNGKLNPFNLF